MERTNSIVVIKAGEPASFNSPFTIIPSVVINCYSEGSSDTSINNNFNVTNQEVYHVETYIAVDSTAGVQWATIDPLAKSSAFVEDNKHADMTRYNITSTAVTIFIQEFPSSVSLSNESFVMALTGYNCINMGHNVTFEIDENKKDLMIFIQTNNWSWQKSDLWKNKV